MPTMLDIGYASRAISKNHYALLKSYHSVYRHGQETQDTLDGLVSLIRG